MRKRRNLKSIEKPQKSQEELQRTAKKPRNTPIPTFENVFDDFSIKEMSSEKQ